MTTSIKFRALTDEDHKLFFEALGEYGKDFQNIQQYIAQKCNNQNKTSNKACDSKSIDQAQERKESEKKEEDRKREQIRNFYNKLYAKLSELVGKIDDQVEKVNQELYLLINYGEIWKRHGFKFNAKTKRLLEELVYQGTTTFRFEKKNVRLRTPACKVLKKINEIGIDEKEKVVTTRELPKDVVVEFHPASNRDWLRVQSTSQNPRLRARLPIQKRISSILEFMEYKWNVSQDKLTRTVDSWLKIAPANNITNSYNNQALECQVGSATTTNNFAESNSAINQTDKHDNLRLLNTTEAINVDSTPVCLAQQRIRLKPSSHHELNEINITRVVPDNHLDLSLNAYVKRLELSRPKGSALESTNRSGGFDGTMGQQQGQQIGSNNNNNIHTEDSVISTGATGMANNRLPVSLTTPDCSILLERSCTSDQSSSIAQTRRHLNILQSLTGTLEGCENSRTAYDDTQDRSLMQMLMNSSNSRFPSQIMNNTLAEHQEQNLSISHQQSNPTIPVNNDIPALYDEDAALPVSSSIEQSSTNNNNIDPQLQQASPQPGNNLPLNADSQQSKFDEFQIPKNVTLLDYFKMAETHNDVAGDDMANDAFPSDTVDDESDPRVEDSDKVLDEQIQEVQSKETKFQDHVIEIKKFADGWTRQDDISVTLGELYLAFKCPDKIILEYEFEQFSESNNNIINNNNGNSHQDNNLVRALNDHQDRQIETPSDDNLMFKLLTAASLSLAHIERQKQELQHKLHEQQSCSKFKRRKGSGQNQTMTRDDIEKTNQLVDETLKQLQPTRLSSYRRAAR